MFRSNPQRELDRKLNLFRESFLLLIADGTYPPDRQERLYQAAQRAGLDWQLARRYVLGEAKAFFEDSIRRVVADGRVTPMEMEYLLRLQRRLGLEHENAPMLNRLYEMAEQKIHALIVERAAYISNPGIVENLKREILTFSLPKARNDTLFALLEEQHVLAKLMSGDLPTVKCSVSLYKTEICHVDMPVSVIPDGGIAQDSGGGRFIVTNERIMFLGERFSFSATWGEVSYCKMYKDFVLVRKRAESYLIFCPNPQYVATLIIGASRRYTVTRDQAPAPHHKRLPDMAEGVNL